MKVEIKTKQLRQVMARAAKFAPDKPLEPIYQNALMIFSPQGLEVVASDSDTFLSQKVDLKTDDYRVVVPAQAVSNYIGSVSSDTVTLEFTNSLLKIVHSSGSIEFPIDDHNLFTYNPLDLDDTPIELNVNDLKNATKSISVSKYEDDLAAFSLCTFLESDGKDATIYAVHGVCSNLITAPCEQQFETIALNSKMFKSIVDELPDSDSAFLYIQDNSISIVSGDIAASMVLTTCKVPPVRQVMAAVTENSFKVDRDQLENACNRGLVVYSRGSNPAFFVDIKVDKNQLKLIIQNENNGNSSIEELECQSDSTFDGLASLKTLQKALKAMDSSEITFTELRQGFLLSGLDQNILISKSFRQL